MAVWRIKFSLGGGHVHCGLFCAKQQNMTFAKCGDFYVRRGEEFTSLLRAFSGAEFIGDGTIGITAACNEHDPEPTEQRARMKLNWHMLTTALLCAAFWAGFIAVVVEACEKAWGGK